ncbi:MAG: hypothetical protein E7565_02200 [Ruminococcaceae bacterium]|nr:hypothetical protein [Oscillospiraceae bacterium]
MNFTKRAMGIVLTLVLLISAVYIPVTLSVSAAPALSVKENVTERFDFENTAGGEINKAELSDKGVGYYGWAGYVTTLADGNKVFTSKDTSQNTWLTKGGFRLNKKDGDAFGVYNIEPSSTYVISLDFRVLSPSKQVGDTVNNASSGIRLSYGATHTDAYDKTNAVNGKRGDVEYILSSAQNSATYTVSSEEGKIEYPYGNEWHSVVYTYTSPANLGDGDKSLLLWCETYPGFHCEIDNLTVTKLGSDMGLVVFNDEYSGKSDLAFGKIGTAVNFPDVSDRANSADHNFEGWCKDQNRTQSVTEATFTSAKQIFYSKWRSPVNITFKDTFNKTETKISGIPGEKFNYPKDPTDKDNKQWFMGWFTDEKYTTEHTSGIFSYSDITLYSLWKSEVKGLTQDFENYNKDSYTVNTNSSGRKVRSNAAYFGVGMSKQQKVTYNNSKYAIKLDWDREMKVDNNNELSYDSARYFHYQDNGIWLGKGIEDKQAYVAKVMVNIEKADTDLRLLVFSAGEANTWQDTTQSAAVTVSKSKAGSGWFEVAIPFVSDFSKSPVWSNTMYLGHMPKENKDIVAYFDDVKIEAVAQPYESLVTIETNYGAEKINIKGKRGEALILPTLTHPDGAEFLGYFADKNLTEEFVLDKFGRGNLTVYAKWSKAPMSFREYPYKDGNKTFGQTMSIINEKGVGINDDYALKFAFKGNDIYQTKEDGTVIYMNTRASQQEHAACIGTVEKGNLYKLSFNYKTGEGNNSGYKMQVVYGADNIWQAEARQVLSNTAVNMSEEETEWQTMEITFVADPPAPTYGNNLFVQFFSNSAKLDANVNAFVDNVMLTKIEGDVVYLFGNGAKDTFVVGKAGDEFKIPEAFKNGRAELLGLYTDAEFENEFTLTAIPTGVTVLYAKWSDAPITFEEEYYPFDTTKGTGFGHTTNIVNEKGLGIDDDWVMRFNLDADAVYNANATGNGKYWLSRVSQRDHVFPIAKLKDGAIYRLTYNYRFANDEDVTVTITPVSGHYNNVWENSVFTSYDGAMVSTTKKDVKWQTYSTYISARVPDVSWTKGDTLFLMLRVNGATMDTYTDLLIDNVLVEEIKAPYIFFDAQNGVINDPVRGKAGEKITFPETPKRHGYTFKGWYLDKDGKEPFTDKTFTQGKGITVYASWSKHSTIKYNFESFGIYPYEQSAKYHLGDAVLHTFGGAHSGNKVIKYDRTGEYNQAASYNPFAADGELFKMDAGKKYAVSIHYYVAKRPTASFTVSVYAGSENNFWDGWKDVGGGGYTVLRNAELGVWKNATFTLDSKDVVDRQSYLYLKFSGGKDGVFYIDDITITEIPVGSVAVTVNKDGCDSIPEILIGKNGQSFASKLPTAPARKGKFFTGYYTLDANGGYVLLEKDKMTFGKESYKVFAKYVDYEVTQNFDTDYKETYEGFPAYSIFDNDFELYDGEKSGNSGDNVTSGRYSLHRKGNSPYFENAVLLTEFKEIASNQRYTLTMKIKMGKHYHTDGAVKFASGRSPKYAWSTSGNYYPIATIAELADGQWHEISFTFNSVERYLSLQTPGYVELFIDDVKLSLVTDKDANPVSTPKEFTEYVPAMRDENGNLLEKNYVVDVSTIIDENIGAKDFKLLYLLIPAGAVIIAAVILLILFKKKKNIRKG